MTVDELLHSFLSLNDDDRSTFLERAHEASQKLPFDSDWLDELEERAAEVDAGRMQVHDWEEASRASRQRFFPNG